MERLGARGADDEGQGVESSDGEDDEDENEGSVRPKSPIEDIRITNEFIQRIHGPTLDIGGLNDHIIERFRNPLTDALDSDPRPSIKMYLSTTHASANTYNNVRAGISTSSPPRGFDDELNRLNAMDSPHNFSSTLSLSRYPMHYVSFPSLIMLSTHS
ncbi:hypothetical protein EV361DRAFT_808025 [Lentinula raphanica]|nr:hypothetical protein EV361DRAFT_808025 [Lentinula raphanica]